MDCPAPNIPYFAGLFDGEGCILISRNSPRAGGKNVSHQLSVTVALTHEATVAWLRKIFGGSVSGPRAQALGTKPVWRWSLYGKNAAVLLSHALPFFKVKKREAEIAIGFHKLLQFQNGGWTKASAGIGRPRLSDFEIKARETFRNALLKQRNYRNLYASEDGLSSS